MFFEGDRIAAMREMIVARDTEGRRKALAKLLPMKRGDFEGIFTAMDGYPVTIRLLDPPLHEFLPHEHETQAALAKTMGMRPEELAAIVESLREANPMLGHRGCRLGITYPEITEMQAQAIFEAAVNVAARGVKVIPEVMVPLVAAVPELKHQVDIVRRVAVEVFKKAKREVAYLVGTMIELPRAALTAEEIATVAEFFSYGPTISRRRPSASPATTRAGSSRPMSRWACSPPTRSRSSISRASASSSGWASSSAAGRARTSRSASVESTAASRRA